MLKVGDTIKCSSKNECVETMYALAQEGIYTDFMYEKDGVIGLWLVVVRVDKD